MALTNRSCDSLKNMNIITATVDKATMIYSYINSNIIVLLILCFNSTAIVYSYHSNLDSNRVEIRRSYDDIIRQTQNAQVAPAAKSSVNLTVYYEVLCPASVDFILEQLAPATERLGSYIDIHLIPYGHAQVHMSWPDHRTDQIMMWPTICNHFMIKLMNMNVRRGSSFIGTTYHQRGGYTFACQHGPHECHGNMMHACAIDVLQNATRAVPFNACLMRRAGYGSPDSYNSALFSCGFILNVNVNGIWDCVNSARGSILLKGYGDETKARRPRYVPFLTLDNSAHRQDEARRNLISTICNMLSPTPPKCYSYQ